MADKRNRLLVFIQNFRFRSDRAFFVVTILLAILPFLVRDPYILNIFIISLIFAILAATWNLHIGYTGLITLGHQGFFGMGAYASALLVMKAGISPWLGLIIAGIVAGILGLLMGLPCLRLRAAPYMCVMTLAFAEIARITCMNLPDLTRGEMGLWGIPTFPDVHLPILGIISFAGGDHTPAYYLILIIFAITMLILHFTLNSHTGLALRAIRGSQDAAESLGVNITFYKLRAFMTGAFFAGVAGSFYAHFLTILTPSSVFPIGLMMEIVVIVTVGGIGNFLGPVLGALLLIGGLEYLRFFGEFRFMAYGVLIVLVLLFMPQGFGGKLFRDKEIAE